MSENIGNGAKTWSGLKVGSVVALGSIIGGVSLAAGLLASPSSTENKLNENSYAELRQEQIENFHKFNPTTLPPVYTKTPDTNDNSENPKPQVECEKDEIEIGDNCIKESECRCFTSDKCVKNGYEFVSRNCDRKCICNSEGWQCEEFECDEDFICLPEKDQSDFGFCSKVNVPENPSTGHCRADSDPHIRQFDGNAFDVMGTCLYTLVQSKDKSFKVNIKNYRAWPTSQATMVESVFIETEKIKIELTVGPVKGNFPEIIEAFITTENKTQNTLAYENDKISLVNSGPIAEVILKDFDVKVTYKAWYWFVDVWVPDTFKDNTEGLCGNFNDDKADDLVSPSGEPYQNTPFGQYNYSLDWIIDNEFCDSDPNFIEPCDDEDVISACSMLLDEKSVFGQCHGVIDPRPFYNNCHIDLCQMNHQMTRCHIYDLYLTSCMTSSKLDICGWSSELKCEKECPNNLFWNDCASTDKIQMCGNEENSIAPPSNSLAPNNVVGMCVCKDGWYLDGDNCVKSKSKCKNCEIEPGVWVQNGYSKQSAHCDMECRCDNGNFSCQSFECDTENFECHQDPDHPDYGECVPKSEGICRAHGDPHLKTFDGTTYDITGTCQYHMVISTKESANQSPFNVRFKSFRRKPKEMVPWIETVWFEFKSRDFKSRFIIEMSRNKISKSIDTIVTESIGNGESEIRKVSKSLGKTQDFEIVSDGKSVIVQTWFGVRVEHVYRTYTAEVYVPKSYSSSVSGLCGNYNNNKSDDFTGADGNIYSYDKFGGFKSSLTWIVENQDDPECDSGNENPDICDVTEEVKEKCNFMKSEYFSDCTERLDENEIDQFYEACLMDYCENETEEERCGIIESFVAICQTHMPSLICHWPEVFGCTPECGQNQYWESCAATMSGKYGKCICNEGFVLLNGKCVTENERGCILPSGLTVSNGWNELSRDCQKKCLCENNEYFCKSNDCNLLSNECLMNSFGDPYCRPNRPSCWPDCGPEYCDGPNCPDNPDGCTGPNCPDKPDGCTGPNCPDKPDGCSGPNCPDKPDGCSGPSCPDKPDGCIGPNCPDKPDGCTGPNCPTPKPCSGPNCGHNPNEPNSCSGPNCPNTNPESCTGSNCSTPKPDPENPNHCSGPNCQNPDPNVCTGPQCPTPKPDNPDNPNHCTGSNCFHTPTPCTGSHCTPTPRPPTPPRPKPPIRPPVKNTGYCRIHSDPHIETFDKSRFDLMGTCLYAAVQPQAGSDEEDDFEISFKNYRPWYNSKAAMVEEVFIKLKLITIHLKMGPLSGRYPTRVYSYIEKNGSTQSVTSVQNEDFRLVNVGSAVTVNLKNKIQINLKAHWWIFEIWVPKKFKNSVEGLCGNYNNDRSDDFLSRDGQKYSSATAAFKESWILDGSNCDPSVPDTNLKCDKQKVARECSKLLGRAFK